MKRETAKIYDKISQIQKRQQLTNEGAVSFLEFSDKNRKAKKSCHKEKKQLWVKESKVSKLDEGE